MAHHIFTVDFKVQFMQVCGDIQNDTYLTIFGRDHKIAAIVFLVFLIVSNIASLAAIPIMHQEIIKQCRRI